MKGNTTRRLVSATSLMTSDKEGLTDYDIEHLMNELYGGYQAQTILSPVQFMLSQVVLQIV